MAARLIGAVLAAIFGVAASAAGQDGSPRLPRLVFDVTLAAPANARDVVPGAASADALPRAEPPDATSPGGTRAPSANELRAAMRLVIDATAPGDVPARVAATGAWPIWLTLAHADATSIDPAAWSDRVREIVAAVPSVAAVELQANGLEPRRTAFLIKVAAAEIRARSLDIPVVLGGDAAAGANRDAVVTSDVAPSIDAYVVGREPAASAAAWMADHDPGASLVTLDVDVPEASAARTFLADAVAGLGLPVTTRGYRLSAAALREVMPVAMRMRDLYAGELVPVTVPDGAFSLHAGGVDESAARRWRVLYNLDTLGTLLVIDSDAPGEQRLEVSLVVPSSGAVAVRDPLTGRDRPALRTHRDDAAQRTEATVVLPGPGAWLVDFNRGAEGGFVQREDVTAERTLSVEEILARHQARQAAERERSPRYVMNGRIQQYFRPTVTDPGFDVITENRFFVDRVEGTEWEERDFSVNGARFGEPRPPFPLLQAEKVLTPPLTIELDARYRYRLQGTETVNGRPAWVVAFEPQTRSQSLYRGTVWIDRETYARLRQHTAQTGLSAPVISNDETQDFAPVRNAAGDEIWLPSRIYNQQLFLIAGRNLLVERRITFSDYDIAPADFVGQRQEARGGNKTMYRDTNVGVRYFVKEGDQRVVSDIATTRAKALALGVTIDPGFEFPLPIGGINYLNFKFRGRSDTQVAVLFAGVLAAGNIQRPKAIADRIDASIDFFAIAPPSTDRVFGPGGEREDQSLLTWPMSTGLNLGWQATTYQRLSGQYLFRFDGYVRDSTTSADYVTPTSTVTNGFGLLYEYRRAGYSVTANGAWSGRMSWRPWGEPDALTRTPSSYLKYQASASKVFYLGAFSKIIVNGAWFGGDRLDRFSQYQFGLFDDTRIHGVPSAGVRYGELAMGRAQYSFNLLDQYRTDVFVDRAWGRVRAHGVPGVVDVPWEPLTGIGLAFNVRIPGRVAFLRGEVGHSFLPRRYDGLGSTTFQVMLLKPLD